jgi:hypothetical protein
MLPRVTSLDQARNWFLGHHEGRCVLEGRDGAVAEADSFPDAETFFAAHGEFDEPRG